MGKDTPEELVVDNSRAVRELGLKYTPVHETVIDAAVSLIVLGVLSIVLYLIRWPVYASARISCWC